VAFIHHGNHVLCVGFLLVEYIWCISYIRKLTYLPFGLFFEGIAQTSCQLDTELYFSNESHNSNFLNETMGKTTDDAYIYPYAVVLVVGILGNILVIISILRQKKLLKSNYYFLVLHLAICDLGTPILILSIISTAVLSENNLLLIPPSIVFSFTYISFFESQE
jgi:hypothetical protein